MPRYQAVAWVCRADLHVREDGVRHEDEAAHVYSDAREGRRDRVHGDGRASGVDIIVLPPSCCRHAARAPSAVGACDCSSLILVADSTAQMKVIGCFERPRSRSIDTTGNSSAIEIAHRLDVPQWSLSTILA
jgi:hypothetical protein